MKHTPGPWRVEQHNSTIEIYSNAFAICGLWRRGSEETELANARLIAAAPEMLEKMEVMRKENARLRYMVDRMKYYLYLLADDDDTEIMGRVEEIAGALNCGRTDE